jgi:hypothetical protein
VARSPTPRPSLIRLSRATRRHLTLESGNIQIFTDRDVLVAQSCIMTEQGGSILMWSSNGNLDAGEGAKTSVSAPPPKSSCDVDHRCSATSRAIPVPSNSNNNQASVIIVEVIGYGGSGGDQNQSPQDQQNKNDDKRSEQQDSNSAVQVLGAGNLSAQAQQYLTPDEKARLNQH